MLLTLQTYREKFERPFLLQSRQFFAEEGLQMVMDMDTAVYLQHVEMRFEQAVAMSAHYLSEKTLPALMVVLEDSLLRPHLSLLVSRGAPALLDADRVEDLRRLFAMCARVDSLPLLKEAWVGYLR
jgi:hypothetical protein